MAPVRYATLSIKNPSSIPMIISVKDADGNEQTVVTLAPGQETTQFTPVDATWTITFDVRATQANLPDEPTSRGGAGVIK